MKICKLDTRYVPSSSSRVCSLYMYNHQFESVRLWWLKSNVSNLEKFITKTIINMMYLLMSCITCMTASRQPLISRIIVFIEYCHFKSFGWSRKIICNNTCSLWLSSLVENYAKKITTEIDCKSWKEPDLQSLNYYRFFFFVLPLQFW